MLVGIRVGEEENKCVGNFLEFARVTPEGSPNNAIKEPAPATGYNLARLSIVGLGHQTSQKNKKVKTHSSLCLQDQLG